MAAAVDAAARAPSRQSAHRSVRESDARSGEYEKWYVERMFVMAPAQAIVARELQTFKDFPPRQKPGSFSVGDALEKLLNAQHSSN